MWETWHCLDSCWSKSEETLAKSWRRRLGWHSLTRWHSLMDLSPGQSKILPWKSNFPSWCLQKSLWYQLCWMGPAHLSPEHFGVFLHRESPWKKPSWCHWVFLVPMCLRQPPSLQGPLRASPAVSRVNSRKRWTVREQKILFACTSSEQRKRRHDREKQRTGFSKIVTWWKIPLLGSDHAKCGCLPKGAYKGEGPQTGPTPGCVCECAGRGGHCLPLLAGSEKRCWSCCCSQAFVGMVSVDPSQRTPTERMVRGSKLL